VRCVRVMLLLLLLCDDVVCAFTRVAFVGFRQRD
jgi:hypothetical protein